MPTPRGSRLPPFLGAYDPVLRRCEPYLVITRHFLDQLDCSPWGLPTLADNVYDPHDVAAAPFLHLLEKLDGLTYGPRGLEMPRWVFYDCAEMVGGLFGYAQRAEQIPPWLRTELEIPNDYRGLVPLSMVTLIPMLPDGAFLGYTLCSINQVAPGAAPTNLRVLTQAMALKIFPVTTLYGTTQWRSPTLGVHARFGPLELLTAFTPAHSLPRTLTFRLPLTNDRIERALSGRPRVGRADLWIDADDTGQLKQIQRRLERGDRMRIVGPAVIKGATTLVPVREGRR